MPCLYITMFFLVYFLFTLTFHPFDICTSKNKTLKFMVWETFKVKMTINNSAICWLCVSTSSV